MFVKINNLYLGRFIIRSQFRDGLKELLTTMAPKVKISMLTGDNESEARVLHELFPENTILKFHQHPGEKLEYIKALQKTGQSVMMVGDGLNDAGALKQSNIGISVSERAANFTPASDAIIDSRVFHKLNLFFDFSRIAKKIIIASFAISFLYNIIGLSFAVMGLLSPIVAAVLMPLSSISVISFATLSTNLLARKRGLHCR